MRLCSVASCEKKHLATGLCTTHYLRRYKNGNLEPRVEWHGLAGTPEQNSWQKIKQRCLNSRNAAYRDYGGRGIRVCERWRRSLSAFYQDMGAKPGRQYSVNRINNEAHYSCGRCEQCARNSWTANCEWATQDVQNNNYRRNVFIKIGGRVQTLTEWCRELGLSYGTISRRRFKGWDPSRMLEIKEAAEYVKSRQ